MAQCHVAICSIVVSVLFSVTADMSPTGDLHVTAIFQGGDVALSLLRRSYMLPWPRTLSGAARPTTLGSTIRLKSAWVDSECIKSLSKMDLTKISKSKRKKHQSGPKNIIWKGLETVDRGLWQTEISDY